MAKALGIESGQPGPSFDQHAAFDGVRPDGPQLGYRAAIPSNRKAFAALDAVDDLTSMIAQIPDGNLTHTLSVSPVRRQRSAVLLGSTKARTEHGRRSKRRLGVPDRYLHSCCYVSAAALVELVMAWWLPEELDEVAVTVGGFEKVPGLVG